MRPAIAAISIVAAIAAMVSAALSLHPAGAYQHVANGGFESGLSGWAPAPGTNPAIATDAPAEGTAHARITIGDSAARLEYPLNGALAAGTYQVSAQGRASSSTTLRLSVQPSGQPRFTVADDSVGTSWSTLAGAFTLNEAANITLIIAAEAVTGTPVDIDDVRIDGAPPVTLTPTATRPPATATPASGEASSVTATLASSTPAPSPTTPTAVDIISGTLRNAGFEQLDAAGLPFAWDKFGGTLSAGSPARGGSHAARLDSATSSTKWLHQAVTVNGGSCYTFDAWLLHNDASVASAFLRISWYASGDAGGQAIDTVDSTTRLDAPSPAYRQLTTGAVHAPADARSARVRIMLAPASDAPAAILVDDAWFGAASPPPPTATPTLLPPIAAADAASQPATSGAASAVRGARARIADDAPAISGGYSAISTGLVINEILYDADQQDVADPDAEWVELYNAGDEPIELAAWSLADGTANDVLPSLVVPPGGFAIVAATDAFLSAHPGLDGPVVVLNGRIGNALGNDGDRLLLVDPAGAIIDAVSWGDDVEALDPPVPDVPAGHSIERKFAGVDSNTADDFIDNDRPSPGFAYTAPNHPKQQASSGGVRIIEGGAGAFGWLPWALATAAAAACAAMLGWRTVETVRRARQP